MKILHVTATHLKKYGGIPKVLKNLSKAQNEIFDTEARVLSIKHEVKELKTPNFHHCVGIKEIRKYILMYNPDVVIFHGLYFLEYIKLSRWLKKKKIIYYIEPHGSFNKNSMSKSTIKKRIAHTILFKNFIRDAHSYIYLNDFERSNSLYKKKNDLIIPNGINTSETLRNRKKFEEYIKIYFMGTIDFYTKGLDYLINGLRMIENNKKHRVMIRFYGPGNKKETEKLENAINEIGNLDIKYLGPVFDNDKIDILENSNIMILTSRTEGFPMTVLEALSYGNPCIVTDGTNVRDFIEDNELGWGTTPEEIGKTILEALEEYTEKKEKYVEHTVSYVTREFSWNKIGEESVRKLSIHKNTH